MLPIFDSLDPAFHHAPMAGVEQVEFATIEKEREVHGLMEVRLTPNAVPGFEDLESLLVVEGETRVLHMLDGRES